jgi:hypothetical protein
MNFVTLLASITGAAQTGFTSPTYTSVEDTAVDINSKQVAVTAVGGTQVGVDTHSVARPFTIAVTRPKQFQVLGRPHPVTGLVSSVPRNTYKFLVRKGVTPLAGQPSQVAIFRGEIEVPAGADIADPANIRAMLSAGFAALNELSAELGDTTLNGIL